MSKLLITGDWQVTPINLPKCYQALDDLIRYAGENQVDTIVHCGDVKNVLNPVDQRVTNFMIQMVQELKAKNIRLLILMGNHDRIGMSADTGSCMPVLSAAGAHVVTRPIQMAMRFGRGDFKDYRLFMVPYPDSVDESRIVFADFAKYADPKDSILFFHQTITGSRLNMLVPSRPGTDIKLSELHPEKYIACIGGHIHMRQQLGENTHYVGSPFATDWGEANQRKGYLLLDLESREVKFLPSTVPGFYDDTYPGFATFSADDFRGATIRTHVLYDSPNNLGTVKELARVNAQKRYPDSIIIVFPERSTDAGDKAPENLSGSSDNDLIVEFLKDNYPESLEETQDQTGAYLAHVLEKAGFIRRSTEGVKIISAKAQNFLCFKEVSVNYESGITVITGQNADWENRSNGSGKTSFLQMPAVALFGKTLKGQAFDAWRRNGAPENETSWVQLDFILPDGRQALLTRQRNPHKLTLFIDGKDFSSGLGNKDSQKTIELLTGLTWDVLTNALYIDQQRISTLLTGTDKDRKAIFSQFLNLERFGIALEYIKSDRKKTQTLIEITERELELVEAKIGQIESFLTSIKPVDLDVLKKKLDVANKYWRAVVLELEKEKVRVAGETKQLSEAIVNTERAIDELTRKIGTAEGKIFPLQKQIARVQSLQATNCPTCFQPVDAAVLEDMVKDWEKQSRQLKSVIAQLQETREQARIYQEDLREKQRNLGTQQNTLQTDAINASTKASLCKNAYNEGLGKKALFDRYDNEKSYYERSETSLKLAHAGQLSDLDFYDFCIHVFSRDGLPAYLSAQLIPRLTLAGEYYSQLFSEGEIRVDFVQDEDDINAVVTNLHGGLTMEDQSQGESRMASLIVAFSLREVAVPCNILILDEPGEGLDATNARVFAAALPQIADKFGSLLVVTHSAFILAELSGERHYEIVKEDGVARVIQ